MGLDPRGIAPREADVTAKPKPKRESSSYSIVRVDTVNARGIPVHLWTTSIKRQGVDIFVLLSTPSSCSRARICLETPGCEVKSASAASDTFKLCRTTSTT